ncbi:fructosamine-3-kinase [Lipingzhangella halophila]|uniref:Fructosamine-3-kinase n=1 Tax=Lipingzhangella halophila TaxID=1783352 RepID=A0A7W7RDK5_9ACTN|nr:fructosamine kinase family protein [Lipingzhangella halophila]MBB4930034.1 fructosamine-3-kinase [Lipingzhangella halophila]
MHGHTVADRVTKLTGREATRATALGGSHAWTAFRVELADGTPLFVKALPEAREDGFSGLFQTEALGLDWLGRPAESLVPDVVAWDSHTLVLSWVEERPPTPRAAEILGRRLADMHTAGAGFFGAERDGFIGPLPLDNTPTADWPRFYAERRLAPYLRRATDRGALTPVDARVVEKVIDSVEDLAGEPEPAARIHGDLWSGNVLWQEGDAVLVDPAAHGGHRETDLAMLALFGLPHLDRVRDSYNEVAPLAAGWRQRIALHQLHPLLVHVSLFGAAYRTTTMDAARAALRV